MISGFNFKKKYGQNFLTDENLLSGIVSDANITNDTSVLEIGAGAGTLTTQIAKVAKKVVSIEIDKELKPYLDLVCEKYKNVEIVFGDFLQLEKDAIQSKFDTKFCVIANLPYYITTPIIFRFLEEDFDVKSLTLMVQKEVAERFVADAGTKDYGAVSVMLQSYADLSISRIVGRELFFPQPNVDSAIIQIDVNKDKYNIEDREKFSQIVKASFAYRRKTLFNCLQMGLGLSKEEAENAIQKAGLPKGVRGEKLTIEEFIKLTNSIEL